MTRAPASARRWSTGCAIFARPPVVIGDGRLLLAADAPGVPPIDLVSIGVAPDRQAAIGDLYARLIDRDDALRSPPSACKCLWRSYAPKDSRCAVADLSGLPSDVEGWSAFKSAYPDSKGFISAWLPAASSDGHRALVFFRVGPNAHGGAGAALLRRVKGRWKCVWCTFRDFN